VVVTSSAFNQKSAVCGLLQEENHEKTELSGNAVRNRRHGIGCFRCSLERYCDERQLAQRPWQPPVEEW